MIVTKLLLLLYLFQFPLSASELENQLFSAINDISSNKLEAGESKIKSILDQKPNFKLALLIYGDLQLSKITSLNNIAGLNNINAKGLINELKIRKLRDNNINNTEDLIPDSLIYSSNPNKKFIFLETDSSSTYLLNKVSNQFRIDKNFYTTIGKNGPFKEFEGDKKTPIGIYKVINRISSSKLPDFYGTGALPINYPNNFDKFSKRTGSGIWFHGVPKETYSRIPLASDGCMVLSNDDFFELNKFVSSLNTTTIISKKINWVNPKQNEDVKNKILATLNKWKDTWESIDTNTYLSFYSRKFKTKKYDYDSWKRMKLKVNNSKTFININIEDIEIYKYPAYPNLFLTFFTQNYKSNNHDSSMLKEILWELENDNLKIISEGGVS